MDNVHRIVEDFLAHQSSNHQSFTVEHYEKTDKVTKIQEILDSLYPETPIPLDHQQFVYIAYSCSFKCTNNRQKGK